MRRERLLGLALLAGLLVVSPQASASSAVSESEIPPWTRAMEKLDAAVAAAGSGEEAENAVDKFLSLVKWEIESRAHPEARTAFEAFHARGGELRAIVGNATPADAARLGSETRAELTNASWAQARAFLAAGEAGEPGFWRDAQGGAFWIPILDSSWNLSRAPEEVRLLAAPATLPVVARDGPQLLDAWLAVVHRRNLLLAEARGATGDVDGQEEATAASWATFGALAPRVREHLGESAVADAAADVDRAAHVAEGAETGDASRGTRVWLSHLALHRLATGPEQTSLAIHDGLTMARTLWEQEPDAAGELLRFANRTIYADPRSLTVASDGRIRDVLLHLERLEAIEPGDRPDEAATHAARALAVLEEAIPVQRGAVVRLDGAGGVRWETTTVHLLVEHPPFEGLESFAFQLSFDPRVLAVDRIEPGVHAEAVHHYADSAKGVIAIDGEFADAPVHDVAHAAAIVFDVVGPKDSVGAVRVTEAHLRLPGGAPALVGTIEDVDIAVVREGTPPEKPEEPPEGNATPREPPGGGRGVPGPGVAPLLAAAALSCRPRGRRHAAPRPLK